MRQRFRLWIFIALWSVSLVSIASVAGVALMNAAGVLGDSIYARAALLVAPAMLSFVLSLIVARAISRPLAVASKAARSFAEGDVTARVPVPPHGGELAELAFAFNAVAEASAARLASLEGSSILQNGELGDAKEELRLRDEDRSRENRIAARMQRRIIPRVEDLPSRLELAFGAGYIPAENTGGDLYDVVRAGKNGIAFLVADVSGRGVTSALIAALVKNAFRGRAAWGSNAAEVLAEVNAELLPVLEDSDHFITAFYAVLDMESGRMSFANAGHPPALLLRRRGGKAEDLDAPGSPLGIEENPNFSAGEVRFEEGDRLLLFTDGLTGARNYRGETFGRERLAEVLLHWGRRPIAELPDSIASDLESFTVGSPRSDDTVLLACEFRAFARPAGGVPHRLTEEEDWRSLARKGAALASAGDLTEAARVYERLLEIEPGDAAALNNLGTLYWRMGRKEEAAEHFRTAGQIDSSDPRVARNLALAERVLSISAKKNSGEAAIPAPAKVPDLPAARSTDALTASPGAIPSGRPEAARAPLAGPVVAPASPAKMSPMPTPAAAEARTEVLEDLDAVEEAEEVEELSPMDETAGLASDDDVEELASADDLEELPEA